MTDTTQSERLADAFHGSQRQSTIIFLTSVPLLITWKYFGSMDFYRDQLAPRFLILDDVEYTAATYMLLAGVFLMGLIPAFVVKFVFHQRLSDYGVTLGDLKKGGRALLVFVPLLVLASYIGTRDPSIREFYPVNPSAAKAYALHALIFLCYYMAWEFHFRGFLQFGLRDSVGWCNAILVQVMASTLLHIGTPASETYMAIIGGLLWGVMAFRTKSLLAGLVLHYLLGVSADYFLLFQG